MIITPSSQVHEILRPEQALATRDFGLLRPEELLTDDFLEFGSSGRIYTKAEILSFLVRAPVSNIAITEFHVSNLAPGILLATYEAERQNADGQTLRSLRSSIWNLRDGRWQMLFHQGTPA